MVFYSGAQELTSDQQSFTTPSFITPTSGQDASVGPFAAGETGAVNSAATCQLIQWYKS
jgi:hypothetical protein